MGRLDRPYGSLADYVNDYRLALRIARKMGRPDLLATVCFLVGNRFSRDRDYGRAMRWFCKGAQALPDHGVFYLQIASLLLQQRKLKEALPFYKLAMERGSLSREMYEIYAEKINEQAP